MHSAGQRTVCGPGEPETAQRASKTAFSAGVRGYEQRYLATIARLREGCMIDTHLSMRSTLRKYARILKRRLLASPVVRGHSMPKKDPPRPRSTVGTVASSGLNVCIGSGGWSCPGWKNLDMPSDSYAMRQNNNLDFAHNLMSRDRLPFEDGSVDNFYCSHVIEHLDDSAVKHLFVEARRCLKSGGVFRLTCPNMELIHAAFVRKDDYFFTRFAFRKYHKDISLTQAFLHTFAFARTLHSPGNYAPKLSDAEVNEIFTQYAFEEACDLIVSGLDALVCNKQFPHSHLNWWTLDKLERFSAEAEFSDFVRQQYNCTTTSAMSSKKYFDCTLPFMSLYCELIA